MCTKICVKPFASRQWDRTWLCSRPLEYWCMLDCFSGNEQCNVFTSSDNTATISWVVTPPTGSSHDVLCEFHSLIVWSGCSLVNVECSGHVCTVISGEMIISLFQIEYLTPQGQTPPPLAPAIRWRVGVCWNTCHVMRGACLQPWPNCGNPSNSSLWTHYYLSALPTLVSVVQVVNQPTMVVQSVYSHIVCISFTTKSHMKRAALCCCHPLGVSVHWKLSMVVSSLVLVVIHIWCQKITLRVGSWE